MNGLPDVAAVEGATLEKKTKSAPNNLVVRAVTILTLGPLLFLCAVHSKLSCTCLIFLGVFIGGVEWAGLKRHLKVALLLWSNSSHTPHDGHLNHHSPVERRPLAEAGTGSASSSLLHPPASPLLPSGVPLRPEEYALPVPPISLYQILKHLGWAGLAVAAYNGIPAFAVTLATYFVIFVCVTLMAHNHLELRMERAISRLQLAGDDSNDDSERAKTHRSSAAEGQQEGAPRGSKSASAASVVEAQRDYFLSLELRMIAEKQPTEQFLDFCLDIFGILWISGLVYPIFYYDLPRVGIPWGCATLLGNFCNDIMALVIGRTFKAIRTRYAAVYETADGDGTRGMGQLASPPLLPVSAANPLLRAILCGPRPLYPAISPNKSTEGAVGGVLTNAVVFAASLYVAYGYVTPLPDAAVIAPHFNCVALWVVVGLAMGVLGVVGDLLQSLLKRSARVKDAGFIVPGHGGALDRLDGAMLVFPFMFSVLSVLQALS